MNNYVRVSHTQDPEELQRNWDVIPEVNQQHWQHKDILTLIEFALIIKGKEPDGQIRERGIRKYCPAEFVKFYFNLKDLVESSTKAGKLAPLRQPPAYSEEYNKDFVYEYDTETLVRWAITKDYDLPPWLASVAYASPVSDTANKYYCMKLDAMYSVWMDVFGTGKINVKAFDGSLNIEGKPVKQLLMEKLKREFRDLSEKDIKQVAESINPIKSNKHLENILKEEEEK